MRTVILIVVAGMVAIAGVAQTPNAVQTCFFSMVGQTTPQYFRLTSLNPLQCEDVTLDNTVLAVRNISNNLIVSSLSGSTTPNHVYTTPLQWVLQQSNTTYTDPAPPVTPFNGQTVWCFSTSIAAFTTWSSQLGQFLPTALVEVRVRSTPAPGELPQVYTTGVTGAAASPTSGLRFLWLKSANACNGNPGVVWTVAAASLPIDAATVGTVLNTAYVVGLL